LASILVGFISNLKFYPRYIGVNTGMSERLKGTVKWFNPSKGYGFIDQEDGEDVFVHYSVIKMDGYRVLRQGQIVEFEVEESPKGLQASEVIPVL